jgi:Protein of unknown function (DUF3341)
MNRMLLAEFSDPATLLKAARGLTQRNQRVLDAFTPFPVEGLAELLGAASTRIRVAMFAGGIAVAALFYAAEWYTAVINYPVNSGGRPLNSWIPFMLPPFATGIFAAAVAGLVFLFVTTGLPRLHYPLFALDGFERVTADRFVLLLARPDSRQEDEATRSWLRDNGALQLWETG